MTDRSAPRRGDWPSSADDEGWGPATAVYSASSGRSHAPSENRPAGGARSGGAARAAATASGSRTRTPDGRAPDPRPARSRSSAAAPPVRPDERGGTRTRDAWTPQGPPTRDKARANRQMERQLESLRTRPKAPERGVNSWFALLVLVAIAFIGGLIDTVASIQVKGGFNIGIIVASIVAILIVKRSKMFPIVIAPPIVYSLAAVFQLYLRSGGLHDKKVIFDAAANYLVYGFPAIATATAAVLIIAGIRLITRR